MTLLFWASLTASCLQAAVEGDVILNYRETVDFHGTGPVWSIGRTARGEVALGADRLFLDEGQRVEALTVPAGYGLRGLATDDTGRLWVGGTGALGYFATAGDGQRKWHSAELPLQKGEEVWKIQPVPGGVAVVTGSRLFRFTDVWEHWELTATPRLVAAGWEQNLWIYQRGRGVLRLEENGPRLVWPENTLPDTPVLWMLGPSPAAASSAERGKRDDHPVLIGTGHGVFLRSDKQWRRLEAVSAAVAAKLPVGAAWLEAPERFAIGTYLGGVVVADTQDRITAVVDRDHGLPDNRVHALWADGDSLWIGLAEGVAKAGGLGAVGRVALNRQSVQALVALPGKLAVIGAQSVSQMAGGKLTPLSPVQAALHDGAWVAGSLWVGGFGGLWQQTATGWRQEYLVSADVTHVVPSKAGELYFIEDTRLKRLDWVADRGWVPRSLAELDDTPVSLFEDATGDVWVGLMKGGVVHYRRDDPPSDRRGLIAPALHLVQQFRPGFGLPPGVQRCRIGAVGGRIYLYYNDGVLRLAETSTRFEVMSGMENLRVLAATGLGENEGALWVVESRNETGLAALRIRNTGEPELLALPGLDGIGRVRTMATAGDGTVWIAGTEAIIAVAPEELRQAGPAEPVTFRSVSTDHGRRLALGGADLPKDAGSVRFTYGLARIGDTAAFSTRLDPVESQWSTPQTRGEREFAGLGPGAYRFEVRAVDPLGRGGPETVYAFAVPTPWYLHPMAWLAYLTAVGLTVAWAMRWRLNRLKRQNEKLNALVAERTQELSQANTNKTEFLENLSHEIRNPLNGLVGLVGLLPEIGLDARGRDVAQSLTACARNLSRVFDEVLSFSKIEYGQVGLRMAPFSLQSLMDEVVSLYRLQAEQRGSRITVTWRGETPAALLGDAEKLEVILSNYVNNALKYAPDEPVDIEVEVEPTAKSDRFTVALSVADRGPGVPPEEQELIFKKFARGAKARDEGTPGTGLGLATCRAYAKLMGGYVGIEGRPGGGSIFYLNLTLSKTEHLPVETMPEIVSSADAMEGLPTPGPHRGRALIVEDHAYNQLVAQRLAERLGYRAEVAADAAEALTKAAGSTFDLVFLDWELPGAKGDEVARRLRTLPGGNEAVILATTAHDSEAIRERCRAAGMDGFALKPYDDRTMLELIEAAQARRAQADGKITFDPEVFRLIGYDDATKSLAAARLYCEQLDECLSTIGSALARDDWPAATAAAHRLRSHAGLAKCAALQHAATALQTQGVLADAAGREPLFAEINRTATALRAAVAAWPGFDDAAIWP